MRPMTEAEPRKRKHLNVAQRRALKTATLQRFVQEYGRKAYPRFDPNDRRYNREVEKAVKHMKPDELDRFLRDDED